MATEAPQPVDTTAQPADTTAQPADTTAQPQLQPEHAAEPAQKPPVKRSWRRKYRKMRIKFDNAMSQSNHLIMEEWKAMGTARRLQAENDQLLDALLDFNSQPRVSARQRFDLSDPASTQAAEQRLHGLREQLNAGALTPEQYAQHADQLHAAQAVQRVQTSLATLEATVPHTTTTDPSALPDGIDLSEHAPGYMSPAHEEEYLLALDQLLDDPAFDPASPHTRTLHLGPSQPPLSEKELTIRNPDSVYSWLRKNQPQVFLQDKDAPHHDNVSEKAAPKGGNKKGRQSNVGGTPGPKEEHDGEDLAAPEAKGKGKKGGGDPDDTAYRPKGGSSRSSKRKREAGEGESKGARKKNRPSAAAASAAAAAAAAAVAVAAPSSAPAPAATG
ncbi:uncharacterized protein EKO05_0005951 [Ascochyta rabiei]|uniref:Uncharacterized protein n=1 Tax=Didymella rabiei TaxID=5454 RepID=A0A163M847_DIDRA|nr:uncharacterized protein EKO05_0005951 [Ascochyta rabiei]KZM28480.1 hypothetical protein ST47_g323 [Ascochyta rabiei]UPX15505.1 hypothetical protein EKO05_0005951 [Ascochyta rabiei]